MAFDPEQLEILKRRAEEDFRLDIAAIERLQRRFITTTANAPATGAPMYSAPPVEAPAPSPVYAPIDPVPVGRPDELTSSLRAMFAASR
jgi:hypothetical protein